MVHCSTSDCSTLHCFLGNRVCTQFLPSFFCSFLRLFLVFFLPCSCSCRKFTGARLPADWQCCVDLCSSRFSMCSPPLLPKQGIGRKISGWDHAGLNVSVKLEFTGRIWNRNWPSSSCSARSSFAGNMRLTVAALCVVLEPSPSFLVLCCLPHSLFAILILSQPSLGKPKSRVCSSTFVVIPRSVRQLECVWQFQLYKRIFAHLHYLLPLLFDGRGCQHVLDSVACKQSRVSLA